jgi:ABC-2 type transport system permease protein
MLRKEFIQAFRDPRMVGIVVVMPLVQVFVFGYAVTTDVRHVETAVLDFDNSQTTRELIARFVGSGYFDVVEHVTDEARGREIMDRSQARAVLRMNSGFEDNLRAGRTAELQVIVDGTDSNTGGIVLDYASRIVQQYSDDVLSARLARLTGRAPKPGRVELQTRAWFNENLESRNYYLPGVMAITLMLVSLLLTSMAVVREREIGTMEQILVTPIRPTEFILGKTVPFALVGFFDVLAITAVGVLWFKIPIRGSLLLLLAGSALYLMTGLGIGLLISTVSRTQQQAMMTSFFFNLPAVLLSGFMFPIANMPKAIQYLTYLDPLRYFLVIIRGVFLKGVGIGTLWPQMGALALMGVVTLWLAARRFRKTLK